jgi:hypothetical protein
MYERPNPFIVDAPHLGHDLRGKSGELGRPAVVDHLPGTLASGNSACYRVKHKDPTQGKLTHRNTGRKEFANLFHGTQAGLIVHS